MAAVSLAFSGALWRRSTLTDALGLMPGHVGPLRLGVVALGTVGLSHLCGELLRRTPLWDDSILQTLETALSGLTGEEWVFAAVGFVIAPAIAEELLFRGLALRGLLSRLTPGGAILGSSILFGAAHLDPGQAIATSVLGVYLGTLAFASRSTRGAILCHMLNNGVALASVGLGDPGLDATPTPAAAGGLVLASLAAVAGVGALIGLLRRGRAHSDLPPV